MPTFGSQFRAAGGRRTTCHFENLYFEGGGWVMHTLEGKGRRSGVPSQQDIAGMSAGLDNPESKVGGIREVKHRSLEDFDVFLRGRRGMKVHEGLTLGFKPLWHFNIGHALFDGLYPAFVSLIQWGLQAKPFRVLLWCAGCWDSNVEHTLPGAYAQREAMYGKFGGLGSTSLGDLSKIPLHRFEEVVFGLGTNGAIIDLNANYTLGACRELNACRIFRDRMYRAYDLEPATRVRRGDGSEGKLRAILVKNRRYSSMEIDSLLKAVQKDHKLSAILSLVPISWSPNVKHHSMQNGDLREHLKIIRDTDVHISGPGTALMYQTFLPDGAVHINLGRTDAPCPRGYMEEYLAEGSPYLRALYYPSDKIMMAKPFTLLLQKAAQILKENPPLPAPLGANLSPVGQVYKAYSWLYFRGKDEEQALREVTPMRLYGGALWPGNGFPETLVCRGAFGVGMPENDKPPMNYCLLDALRKSFDMQFPELRLDGKGWFKTGSR